MLILLTLFSFILQINQCSSKAVIQDLSNESRTENRENPNFPQLSYRILDIVCTKEDVCYLIVYLDSEHFTEEDLIKIAKALSERFENKKGLTVNLFDDYELAEAYASGKKEQLNLFSDIRGRYVRGGDKEFLIFSPDKSRLNDSDNVIRLNLKVIGKI